MNENTIEKEIISIIADVSGFEAEEITTESKLATDLEIDSIKAIEIVVAIEKKYKVSIRDEDISRFTSVQHILDLLKNLTQQAMCS